MRLGKSLVSRTAEPLGGKCFVFGDSKSTFVHYGKVMLCTCVLLQRGRAKPLCRLRKILTNLVASVKKQSKLNLGRNVPVFRE